MPPKGCFENNFDDYSPEIASSLLNDSREGLSGKFLMKLKSFKTVKLTDLTTNLKDDIFYDGTVYTGSAGLALYYFMGSLGKEKALDYLKLASDYIDLDNLKGRRISFLCGDAGPLALATVISYKMGNEAPESWPNYKNLTKRLMSLISLLDQSPDELLYGKSGYLYALLFVNKYLESSDAIPASHIEKVISSILSSGKEYSAQMKSESPLLWNWHDKIYFGAAHGIAGILYMLLQARMYINTSEIRTYIKPAMDWLMCQRYPSGNFASSLGSTSGDTLVQWCHGAPGFVPLSIIAYQVFEDKKYLKIAISCGEVVWKRGICVKGFSICHGVSGNAYTFLQLYQATKKEEHLYRACCFMEWCVAQRSGSQLRAPDRPASLFEGLVGRLYLAQDIARPDQARFPALCL